MSLGEFTGQVAIHLLIAGIGFGLGWVIARKP